jgi:hypothetical protein
MVMNHLTEEQLVLYHYGDAERDDAGRIEEHLHACAACQADLDGIRRALTAVDALYVPDRGDGYGADVWARLQPSLGQATGPWWERVAVFFAPRRLALAGAVAALIVAAFVAGRVVPSTHTAAPSATTAAAASGSPTASPSPAAATPGTTSPAAPQQATADRELVRERILLVAVGDHLERSQIALVELVNSHSGPTVDISGERNLARDLVTENRLYRQAALTTGEPGVASVLDDLERVLVEIANSPSTMTGEEFNQVRKRIEQQGIIFKVRVFGDSVRARENRAVAANAGIIG